MVCLRLCWPACHQGFSRNTSCRRFIGDKRLTSDFRVSKSTFSQNIQYRIIFVGSERYMLRFLMIVTLSAVFASIYLPLYMIVKHQIKFVFQASWIKPLGLHLTGVNFRNYESVWTSGRSCSTGFTPLQDLYLHRTTFKTHTHTQTNRHPSVLRMGFEPLL